jgi:hypothetical protein
MTKRIHLKTSKEISVSKVAYKILKKKRRLSKIGKIIKEHFR